jgi:hypothetical protein
MKRCVSDRTLWLVHEGEAHPEEQSHVRACLLCVARHDRLARDLDVLSSTLRALPVGSRRRGVAFAVGWRRAGVAAMLAGFVAVAGVGAWHARPSRPALPNRSVESRVVPSPAEDIPFLGDVSTVLVPPASSTPAAAEIAWLDDDLVAATVSSETGLDSLISWDPRLDREPSRDAATESDT